MGPLTVTPEKVAKKIKAMKDNKSPGVDGIPPKLLMETVEQISIPHDSKSFYAYVRSKQNVQDKVGPLEDSAGNIVSRVFNGGRPKWLLQFCVYQRRY